MKKFLPLALLLSLGLFAASGCAKTEMGTEKTETATTPGGETTTHTESSTTTTGENPPAANP